MIIGHIDLPKCKHNLVFAQCVLCKPGGLRRVPVQFRRGQWVPDLWARVVDPRCGVFVRKPGDVLDRMLITRSERA